MNKTVTLYTADGRQIGEFPFKESIGRKYARIGSRWVRIGRTDDGLMVEVWWEKSFWVDAHGEPVEDAR